MGQPNTFDIYKYYSTKSKKYLLQARKWDVLCCVKGQPLNETTEEEEVENPETVQEDAPLPEQEVQPSTEPTPQAGPSRRRFMRKRASGMFISIHTVWGHMWLSSMHLNLYRIHPAWVEPASPIELTT